LNTLLDQDLCNNSTRCSEFLPSRQ